jgi:predicted glutamate--cysteine ligase
MFPKTPAQVPLFTSHQHYIDWTEEQLKIGTMQNVRHLWSSVRPNGDRRPYELNRLELRVCDLIIDPIALLAVTALLEARIWQLMANPDLDPLVSSKFTPAELVDITNANESAAAGSSLEATLQHWQDGRQIIASDWIQEIYADVTGFAKEQGFKCFLTPVQQILTTGNTAQQWLREYALDQNSRAVIVRSIEQMRQQEIELADKACESVG